VVLSKKACFVSIRNFHVIENARLAAISNRKLYRLEISFSRAVRPFVHTTPVLFPRFFAEFFSATARISASKNSQGYHAQNAISIVGNTEYGTHRTTRGGMGTASGDAARGGQLPRRQNGTPK
jgi:hypothetical protein